VLGVVSMPLVGLAPCPSAWHGARAGPRQAWTTLSRMVSLGSAKWQRRGVDMLYGLCLYLPLGLAWPGACTASPTKQVRAEV
jgi:hypothetical protein